MPVARGAPGAAQRFEFDVVVVGGGIAGLSAALSATEAGARAVLVEKAPLPERGGNTRFADAQMRFPHEPDEYGQRAYTADEMYDDLMRISSGRANQELIRTLCDNAAGAIEWLTAYGVEWEEGYPHTAGYRRMPKSGGQGLVDLLYRRLEGLNVPVSYQTAASDLILDSDGSVCGVRCASPDGITDIEAAGGVILSCGGFQANVEMRVRYLGRFADSLILRGSRYNTGEGLTMAMAAGAAPAGQWGDYHSAVLDARSPAVECGVTALYNYQMGIFVDSRGQRFIDEGEDFRDHTYVKFSKRIIEEAGGRAWCLFDQRAYQREEFARAWRPVGPPFEAETLTDLARDIGLPGRICWKLWPPTTPPSSMATTTSTGSTARARAASRLPRATGPCHSIPRPTSPSPSRVASRSRSEGSAVTRVPASATPPATTSPGSTPRASPWASSSTTTTPAPAPSSAEPSSDVSPAARPPPERQTRTVRARPGPAPPPGTP